MASETQSTADGLLNDFRAVISHAEELLKATADQSGDKIDAVRARASANLRDARRKLRELEGGIIDRSRAAAKATDRYVHNKPWQTLAVVTTVSFLIGMLTARR